MHNPHASGDASFVVERRLELGPDQTVSVPSVIGTTLVCLKGPLWLTQEGEWRDYILVDGMRFVSGAPGKIVVSALDTAGQALVYVPLPGARSDLSPGLHIDGEAIERAVQRARVARSQEVGRLLEQFFSVVARGIRRLFRGRRNHGPRLPLTDA